eukprot:gene9996-biopygen4025
MSCVCVAPKESGADAGTGPGTDAGAGTGAGTCPGTGAGTGAGTSIGFADEILTSDSSVVTTVNQCDPPSNDAMLLQHITPKREEAGASCFCHSERAVFIVWGATSKG